MVLGAIIGGSGTRGPRPPGPKEPIIGMIGGIVAVAGFSWGLGFAAAPSAAELVVLSIAAFAGGRFLIDVVNLVVKPPVSN
jgi:hypothetical protein